MNDANRTGIHEAIWQIFDTSLTGCGPTLRNDISADYSSNAE